MDDAKIKKAVALAQKTGHVFLATADPDGVPHITAAGKVHSRRPGHVTITEWFCPGTMKNLRTNVNLSVVIWDSASDTGYQLVGKLDTINDIGVLDGLAPELESEPPLPQVEKQVQISVEKTLDFKLAPHSDKEE